MTYLQYLYTCSPVWRSEEEGPSLGIQEERTATEENQRRSSLGQQDGSGSTGGDQTEAGLNTKPARMEMQALIWTRMSTKIVDKSADRDFGKAGVKDF
jgi:hypothetical protein